MTLTAILIAGPGVRDRDFRMIKYSHAACPWFTRDSLSLPKLLSSPAPGVGTPKNILGPYFFTLSNKTAFIYGKANKPDQGTT